jgi:hypothetical protein
VINRGYVPGASLSEGAKALMANYDFGDGGGCPPGGDDVCPPVVVIGDLPEPVQDEPWHPDNVVLAPDDPPQSIHDSGLFRPQGIEEFAITEASIARFNAVIVDRLATDPEAVEEMLIDLRASIDELLVRVGPEVLLDVRVICAALPSELCQRHFGDLPQPAPPSDATLRRFTGAGHMNDPERTKFTLGLHCNPLVGHNRFKVAWGNKPTHQFETDLLTSAACETAPEPLRTHRGWGLGKLDGSPGAKAHWSLTDAGEPGRDDTVVIEIYDPENNLLRRVEGRISGGNLQAHER